MSENNVNANVNGDDIKKEEENNGNHGQTVPYSRFQEVNAKRKAAEETLTNIVNELCEEVPESMRNLIPNLAPADKIKWLQNAKKQGLFNTQKNESISGPDAKRPIAKPNEDLTNLSSVAMIARGYNK